MGQSFKCFVHLDIQSLADSTRILCWRKRESFTIRNDQAKDGQKSTWQRLLSCVRLLSLFFLASEKVKVLNHPTYSPDLSPCDFFLFPRLKKMLSGNKYTSRSSLGSAIYQCLQQIPKEDYLSAFRDWVRTLVFQYISYFRSQITFICACLIYFSSILQIWYIEVRISRSISEFLGLRDNESRLYLTRVFSPNNRSKLGCFSRNVRTRTFGHVRSAKIQISLRIHEVWSLFIWCIFG